MGGIPALCLAPASGVRRSDACPGAVQRLGLGAGGPGGWVSSEPVWPRPGLVGLVGLRAFAGQAGRALGWVGEAGGHMGTRTLGFEVYVKGSGRCL